MPSSPFPPSQSPTKAKVHEISDATFSRAKKGLAVVQMKAEWCGHCGEISKLVDEISKEQICNLKGECISVFRMDIDKAPKMADKLKIEGVPTILFLKNGKEAGRVMGTDRSAIRKGLKKLVRK